VGRPHEDRRHIAKASSGRSVGFRFPRRRALTGAVLLPAPADAVFTRGFHVYNVSAHPIRFTGVHGADFDSTPPVGQVRDPGFGYDDFEQVYYFLTGTYGWATYDILGDNGQVIGGFTAEMWIDVEGGTEVNCDTSVGVCTPHPNPAEGYTITL
jgi:hypothetical protein